MRLCQFSLMVPEVETAETKTSTRRPREVEDGLWERTAPLLPQVKRSPIRPGRPRLDDRRALCGILFVLYIGIRWEFLPQELGYGSSMPCWRRLRDWNEAGVWQRLHELLLAELRGAGLLDFSRAAVDSSNLRAMKGGPATGPSPVGRGRIGSKHHLLVKAHGIPPAAITTGGNRNDVTQLLPLIQAVPPVRGVRGVRGRHRQRPRHLYADRGYGHEVPRSGACLADHSAHRPARTCPRLGAGRVSLGRRGRIRPAALVLPPTHPLGDP